MLLRVLIVSALLGESGLLLRFAVVAAAVAVAVVVVVVVAVALIFAFSV